MGGVKAWVGYATGIAASVAIIELMGAPGVRVLPLAGGMHLPMALAVFVVVIPAIMSENLKNMVPALFIGSGAFFGLSSIIGASPDLAAECKWCNYGLATRAELVYCAVGLLFGFITVYWRGKYEAALSTKA